MHEPAKRFFRDNALSDEIAQQLIGSVMVFPDALVDPWTRADSSDRADGLGERRAGPPAPPRPPPAPPPGGNTPQSGAGRGGGGPAQPWSTCGRRAGGVRSSEWLGGRSDSR